jgi:hypothetical protein
VLLGQCANAANNVSGSVAVIDDQFSRRPRVLHVLAVEPVQARRGVVHDRRQRLVDLVRDRSARLSERRHPAHVGQLRMGMSQRPFGPLAPGELASYSGLRKTNEQRAPQTPTTVCQ